VSGSRRKRQQESLEKPIGENANLNRTINDQLSTHVHRKRAVLVGVGLKSQDILETKNSLTELVELAHSAQIDVVGLLHQFVEKYNPATLMGSGKAEEIVQLIAETRAQLVILDQRLSGVQQRNLEQVFNVVVLDRTQLILEIFAQRAHSFEGKLQVDLARLLDLSSRMVGAWQGSLSRQGAGIGTRGPGERALERDRRIIKNRISQIKKELSSVGQNRAQHRAQRRKQQIPTVALIGYTNVGKSTLLNQLTQSEVPAEDKLFATLDPTTRKLWLGGTPRAVLVDTVGFIRNLPTQLIEAFKATLEESSEADLLLHVVDLSNSQWPQQMEVVNSLMKELKWDIPIICVFNKIELAPPEAKFKVRESPRAFVSALTGEGIPQLKQLIKENLESRQTKIELFIPKELHHKIFELGRESKILSQEEGTQGTVCLALISPTLVGKWREYMTGAEYV